MSIAPTVQSLWLADHAQQDQKTGKVSVMGLFDAIDVEPGEDFTSPSCLFFCLRGVHDSVALNVLYLDLSDNSVLLEQEIEVPGEPLVTATVCLPLDRIPVPHAGSYVWVLQYGDDALGESRVEARIASHDEDDSYGE